MRRNLTWESLTVNAFKSWLDRQGKPVGSPESTAFRWFVSDMAGEVVDIAQGWIKTKHSGTMIRVPAWAEKLPARCSAEDLQKS